MILIFNGKSTPNEKYSKIACCIGDASGCKARCAQAAAIALAARSPLLVGLVAGYGQRIVNPQTHAFGNDLRLAHILQRRTNTKSRAFHASTRPSGVSALSTAV